LDKENIKELEAIDIPKEYKEIYIDGKRSY